ncbi:MAG TPA: TIGR02147 family protein [Bdellovibrionales bacterium]|nr:TIGR02147 family protein [Bdellovibrionales bacterium]
MTEDQSLRFRLWLQQQFSDRCKRNSRLTLRGFAKSIDLHPATISQIMSGKRGVSKTSMHNICRKLPATTIELKSFGLLDSANGTEESYQQISIDSFAVISDWYHYGILELTYVEGFKADPKWIARKLDITAEEAKAAIERLVRLDLLREENGALVKTHKTVTNDYDGFEINAAHQSLQKHVIQKALTAVESCTLREKDLSSITMAIDIGKLPIATDMIKKFRRELCALLEDGQQTRVYNLGIQLYPISISEESA